MNDEPLDMRVHPAVNGFIAELISAFASDGALRVWEVCYRDQLWQLAQRELERLQTELAQYRQEFKNIHGTRAKESLEVGDIVLLKPETTRNRAFAGALMVVTEVKTWGAQGYVQALGENREQPGGQAYYRAQWDEMLSTGGRVPEVDDDE